MPEGAESDNGDSEGSEPLSVEMCSRGIEIGFHFCRGEG